MNNFKSKYLELEWDVPYFVKLDPKYEFLFELEAEIFMTDNGLFGVNFEDDKELEVMEKESFFEVYDEVWRMDKYDIVWSEELAQVVFKDYVEDGVFDFGMYFVPTDESKKTYWLYSSSGGATSVNVLVDDYSNWKKMNDALDEHSFIADNFYNVYEWLNKHPDFWRQIAISPKKKPLWETDTGVSWLSSFPYIDDEGYYPPLVFDKDKHEIRWRIEGGSHVLESKGQPDLQFCSTRYWDPFVIGNGKTYEEAILDYGKKYFIKRPWTNDDTDTISCEERRAFKRYLGIDELDSE